MLDDYSPFKSRVAEIIESTSPESRRFKMARWMRAQGISTQGVEHWIEEGKFGNEWAVENLLLDQVARCGDVRILADFVVEFELHIEIITRLKF